MPTSSELQLASLTVHHLPVWAWHSLAEVGVDSPLEKYLWSLARPGHIHYGGLYQDVQKQHVCAYSCVCTCICWFMCIWMSEVDIRYLFQPLSSLGFWDRVSYTEPWAHSWTGWTVNSGDLPISSQHSPEVTAVCYHTCIFMWVLGFWKQVFKHALRVFC